MISMGKTGLLVVYCGGLIDEILGLKDLKVLHTYFVSMENALYFSSHQDWRSWLSKNHDSVKEVWLVLYKKGSTTRELTLVEAVEEAICFGWIDGKLRNLDNERFALRFSPRKPDSVWSKINKERAEKLIATGKMTAAGLATVEAAKEAGTWNNAYTNLTRDTVPPDLKAALTKEPLAWGNFSKFANTYQNMYVGWVEQAKTKQTRQRRIEKVVEQSLKNKKQIFL